MVSSQRFIQEVDMAKAITRLLDALRRMYRRASGAEKQWVSEEELFAADLAELDSREPGWDTAKGIITQCIEAELGLICNMHILVGWKEGLHTVRARIPLPLLQRRIKERIETQYGTPTSRFAARAIFYVFDHLPERLRKKVEDYADSISPPDVGENDAVGIPEEIPEEVLADIMPPTTLALRTEWLPLIVAQYPNATLLHDVLEFDVEVPAKRSPFAR